MLIGQNNCGVHCRINAAAAICAAFPFFWRWGGALGDRALPAGADGDALYEKMRVFPPVFFFIDDLSDFTEAVYYPKPEVPDMSGFLENITEKGRGHNVYFFVCADPQNAGLTGLKMYDNLTAGGAGIHFGGKVAGQSFFRFDYIPYLRAGEREKPGIGYLPSGPEEDGAGAVVVPNL